MERTARIRLSSVSVDHVTFYLVLLACWSGGAWIRARQAGEAERSREEAELAIERERARIARDLHDVVTHHVTARGISHGDLAQGVTTANSALCSFKVATSDPEEMMDWGWYN